MICHLSYYLSLRVSHVYRWYARRDLYEYWMYGDNNCHLRWQWMSWTYTNYEICNQWYGSMNSPNESNSYWICVQWVVYRNNWRNCSHYSYDSIWRCDIFCTVDSKSLHCHLQWQWLYIMSDVNSVYHIWNTSKSVWQWILQKWIYIRRMGIYSSMMSTYLCQYC